MVHKLNYLALAIGQAAREIRVYLGAHAKLLWRVSHATEEECQAVLNTWELTFDQRAVD